MPTVFIWSNNWMTHHVASRVGYAPASDNVPGHVSLSLNDDIGPVLFLEDQRHYYTNFHDNTAVHASWIPSYMKRLVQRRRAHGRVESGVGNWNFFADLYLLQYAPDHIIRIPAPSDEARHLMREEWARHLGKKHGRDHGYDPIRKNSARIVSRILRAAWSTGPNLRYGQMLSGIWTPNMIYRLASRISAHASSDREPRPMRWEELVREMRDKGAIGNEVEKLLLRYRKRSSLHGTSGADSRFQTEGSWKSLLGRGWKMEAEDENFSAIAFVIADVIDKTGDTAFARKVGKQWFMDSFGITNPVSADTQVALLLDYIHGYGVRPKSEVAHQRGLGLKRNTT